MREPDINETGQDARGVLLAGSSDVPPETGVPSGGRAHGTTARPRQRVLRRWMLVSAGAAAVAAGVTAALLAASAARAPTALTAVTSALAKTSADSYSFSLDSTIQFRERQTHSDVVSGAFDPRHGLGTELLATRVKQRQVTAQVRFIGRYVYTCVSSGPGTLGRPWNKALVTPVAADGIPAGYEVYGFVTDHPVSAAEFSGVLRSAGTVRDEGPASGAGWTGIKYVITARFPEARESVTATVYIDQQGRVRRLVTITTQGAFMTDRDLTFGDFGSPVSATAPPTNQVKSTSRPYWGFLF